MFNVYRSCPSFATPRFTLRLVRMEDAPALLRVYSDKQAQGCFNADNCTSDFRYATLREMEDCIRMWLRCYENQEFVRWTILRLDAPIGTVEMFRRSAGEDGLGEGVLRIDVGCRYEYADVFDELLQTLLPAMHQQFGCARVLTKAMPHMLQRRLALVLHGFVPSKSLLTGKNGVEYGNYWGHRHLSG